VIASTLQTEDAAISAIAEESSPGLEHFGQMILSKARQKMAAPARRPSRPHPRHVFRPLLPRHRRIIVTPSIRPGLRRADDKTPATQTTESVPPHRSQSSTLFRTQAEAVEVDCQHARSSKYCSACSSRDRPGETLGVRLRPAAEAWRSSGRRGP